MIIGITGKIGAGKTTVACIMQKVLANHGIESKVVAFADALKQSYEAITGESCQTHLEKQMATAMPIFMPAGQGLPLTRRENLIQYAEYMRAKNPDIWINALAARYPLHDPAQHFIIHDVRFRNELALVERYGGAMLRVHRENNPYPALHDPTEKHLDSVYMRRIKNDGDFDHLNYSVKHFLKTINIIV